MPRAMGYSRGLRTCQSPLARGLSVPLGARSVGRMQEWPGRQRVGVAHGPSVSASGRGEVSTQCARAVRALAPPCLRECVQYVRRPPGVVHDSWAGLLPPMAAAATTRDHLLSTVAHTSGWGLQCGHDKPLEELERLILNHLLN